MHFNPNSKLHSSTKI